MVSSILEYLNTKPLDPSLPAHRLITQVVIVGSRIIGRSFAAAYRQAQASSQYARAQAKLNPEDRTAIRGGGASGITLQEACKILNVKPPKEGKLNPEEVVERYKRLFDANDPKKGGSFYLQSKVVRAKERLDAELGKAAERMEAEESMKEGFKPKIYKDR
ncbi:probable mitochondria-associated signaling protein [Cephalotrichum gorgonifer]|uniref:Mitochondrial import inner membrane translocase subunit TIM16 n=1 Tax=Cephalotrichum gorgonifer TaxID=2041049 RepID=A0AAE8N8P4_9PEZI|nr:probable mitochondria-associated signaling protein [Cephalotrichum gorgonifer]